MADPPQAADVSEAAEGVRVAAVPLAVLTCGTQTPSPEGVDDAQHGTREIQSSRTLSQLKAILSNFFEDTPGMPARRVRTRSITWLTNRPE